MVERAAARVALALLVAAAAPPSAKAQTLQRLNVQSFDLSSDAAAPRVDVPFHLIVRLRVRQRISQISNLDLPMLAQLELQGDERETVANGRGTIYRETIAVVARTAGSLAIAPATLQAIDARDGKPKEWYTNGLTLAVGGPPVRIPRAGRRVVLWAAGALAVALLALVLLRRRRVAEPRAAAPPPPAPPPAAPPPLVRTRSQQAQDALAVLRAERTRAAAVRVRAAMWRMIGASEGETLGDVLRRPEALEPAIRALLVALERSAFTYDADLRAAIEDACSALDRYIEAAA